MSKFNARVPSAPDQVLTDAPVRDLREQTPEPSGSIFDEMTQQPAQQPVLTSTQPEMTFADIDALEAQKDQEAIPDIATRREQALAESAAGVNTQRYAQDKEDIKPLPAKSADGGLERRANNLAMSVKEGRLGAKGMFTSGDVRNIMTKARLPTDPELAAPYMGIASYVVENMWGEIADASSSKIVEDTMDDKGNKITPEVSTFGTVELNPEGNPEVPLHKSNAKVGKEIFKEWNRYAAAQAGEQAGRYDPDALSEDEAIKLGQLAKELYYEANKHDGEDALLIRRDPDDTRKYVTYEITKYGADKFKQGAAVRKALFPRQHVRPLNTPTPELKGEGRTVVKGVSGKKGKGTLNHGQIKQAVNNLTKVSNVVDPQRMAILFSTIIPALRGDNNPLTDAFANMYGIGSKKMSEFEVQKTIADRKAAKDLFEGKDAGKPYDPAENMNNQKRTVAQSVYGVALERNKSNHLTYDITAYNGRITPQQTHFDPTNSKVVRFVTRNATPVEVKPNSRQQAAMVQMFAMLLVKDADKFLFKGRAEQLKANDGKLRAWGERVRDVVNNSMTKEQAEAVAQAIEQGIPLNDERFPQVGGLQLDPERDADIIKAMNDRDEGDGPVFLDALIDYANYRDAMDAGRPYYSFLNVYIDGKTNGIASNGLQLGSEKIALRTGVTRSKDSVYAVDNDKDIRDELADVLANNPDSILNQGTDGSLDEATGGNSDAFYAIAKKVFNTKKLLKGTTMTYGYGREMDNFIEEVTEAVETVLADPDYAPLAKVLSDNGFGAEKISNTLFGQFTSGLGQVMEERGMEARNMMHGAAALFAMMDELFEITSPVGAKLRYGGVVPGGAASATSLGQMTITGEDGNRGTKAYKYENKATSAAIKQTDKGPHIGGEAWGGAIPGPVQAIDSATIVKSLTGKSWEKLVDASDGNPYIHTIHDAFKLDANGYFTMLDEINNNWAEAGLEWSYLEQTKDSMNAGIKAFRDKLNRLPPNAELDLSINGDFRMIGWLLEKGDAFEGHMPNLYKMMIKLAPPGIDAQDWAKATTNNFTYNIKAMGLVGADKATPKQVKIFVDKFIEAIEFPSRLRTLIKETEEGKAEIKKAIKNKKIYQYYTH